MGVLAPRLCRLDVSLSPQWHERKFVGATVCKVTFKHLPPTPKNLYPKFRNPRTTFENPPLCAKYNIVKGRSPKFVFGWKTNICVTPCIFPEPFLPSSRKKSKEEEERKRKRNNTLKIGHYVLPGTPKGSALTLLRPTFPDFAFIYFVTSSVLR